MKEIETTGNSRHADPTTRSPLIELLPSMAVVCTAGIAQAARWKYVVWLSITSRPHLSPAAKNQVSASTTYQMDAAIPKK